MKFQKSYFYSSCSFYDLYRLTQKTTAPRHSFMGNGPLEKMTMKEKHTTKTSESIAPRSKSFYPKGKIQDEPSSCAREEDMALLAYDHEGYAYADYFKHQGIALIVLKYRMPHGNHKVPMSDVCDGRRS